MKKGGRSRGLGFLVIMALLLIGVGCQPAPPARDPAETGLYNLITQENDYHKWKMWPGRTELYPGTEPHGFFLTTYVTDEAFSAIENRQGSIPEGSIIVKENYRPDKTLDAVTVMYKVKDFDPRNNDWFWLKYAADGTIQTSGKVPGCIGCHGKERANDFVFSSDLSAP